MDWKEGFYQAIKEYAKLPDEAAVTDVDESCYYYEGCSTCGGDYEWYVDISYTLNGKGKCKTTEGKLSDFINSL